MPVDTYCGCVGIGKSEISINLARYLILIIWDYESKHNGYF